MAGTTDSVGYLASQATFLTNLRRDIHAHPELGFQEHRTSELIAQTLSAWGIPVHRGLGGTGLVGVIQGREGRGSIGLRADMDALPMAERNTFAHASVHAGRMHACGHDGHITMLLAAAKYMAAHRTFDGTVYLIFQPAEEGGAGGARRMIEEGLFKQFPMDAIFGVHNWPGLPAGKFAVQSGPVFASSNEFEITIRGKGAHAAMPHNGIDPIPIGCEMVHMFQTIITRNKRPLDAAVISVTVIKAGEAVNVIPDTCLLRGTVRAFSNDVLDLIEGRMRQISESVCAAYGSTCEFNFHRRYPPTTNHESEARFVRDALIEFAGQENVAEFEPTMAAEDFSFYLLERPGCYFVIGNGTGNSLHNPSYDFNDDLITSGGAMWVRLAEAWFSRARP